MLRAARRCGACGTLRAPLENAPRFLSSALSRGSNPRIRQQKARIPRDTGSAIRLAESWGFEPQIPLWGILA